MFKFSVDYKKDWLGIKSRAVGYDKWAHLAGCFFFTCLASLVLPIAIAEFVIVVAGIILEIWQGFKNEWGFSFMDIVFNIIGCVLAYGFVSFALLLAFM